MGLLPSDIHQSIADGISYDARFIVGKLFVFDPGTFTTTVIAALWRDIDGVVESPATQKASDYELVVLQTPAGDFDHSAALSVTTIDDGSWLASGTSKNGAWLYPEGMEGPLYIADILADEGADLDWDPQAVERVRYDSESGWLHMAVSGSSYYVGLQIAEPTATPAGDIDGDSDFDANDSFLMQLILLSGSDAQIDQAKGSSTLTASQIRSAFAARASETDVDGDGAVTANDGFLIHLVQLAGTNAQVDLSKGASPLTAVEIRANINALSHTPGNTNGNMATASSGAVLQAVLAAPMVSSVLEGRESPLSVVEDMHHRDMFSTQDDVPVTRSPTSVAGGERAIANRPGGRSFRDWIDAL